MRNRTAVLVVLLLAAAALAAYAVLRSRGDSEAVAGTVPTVVGLREAPARTALRAGGFAVDAERQPAQQPSGVVVAQDPAEGSSLVSGGVVHITVSSGPAPPGAGTTETETETETQPGAPTVTTTPDSGLPSLLRLDYRTAVRQLLAARLLPDTYPVESPFDRGLVVAQSPAVGMDLPPGSGLRLNVSLGSGERAPRPLPDLTGLRLPEAMRRCAASGFTCRTLNERGLRRVVARQQPAAGRSVAELTQITLTTRGA